MSWPWSRWRDVADEETPWVWPESSGAGTDEKTASSSGYAFPAMGRYDGANFLGAVSGQIDEIANLDYYTLRARSAALFYGNLYARGIIRRLVTNVINTGLAVECIPEVSVLGLSEDALVDWSERIEKRFGLYGQSKQIIDAKGYRTDGDLQRQIYTEALVGGDCLVINRQNPETGLPQIQIVCGDRIENPPELAMNSDIVDGVKLDSRGRHLGYWIRNDTVDRPVNIDQWEDRYTYIPARGEKSGRRTAWLVYGPDKREDGVRGEPLLGIAITALKTILNYRDSAALKADLNSKIVGFIKRTKDVPPSMNLSQGAVRRTEVTADATGETPPVTMQEVLPGMYLERLQPGEEPAPYSQMGTDVNFGPFEAAVIAGLAWALEIPPEILILSFRSNYSASQAALQEFKIFLNKERPRFAGEHCQNLLEEWFIAELLIGKIQAGEFLAAYTDPMRYDEVAAWLKTDWNGAIKPSVDIVKQTVGYKTMVNECWITNDRASRELTGTKYSENCRRVRRENELKIDAIRPILEAQEQYGEKNVKEALASSDDLIAALQQFYLGEDEKEEEEKAA